MYFNYDKIIIFICAISLYLLEGRTSYEIIPVLIAVLVTSLNSYFDDRRVKLGFYLIFIAICYFIPNCLIFIPLLIYDIALYDYQILTALAFLPLLMNHEQYTTYIIVLTIIFCILSFILKSKSSFSTKLQREFNELQDTSKELSLLQEEKNQSILENQDYEINVATLNERNRISKEIHDNIGHLLSRSLLQIGALLTISKEEPVREGLSTLKDSISSGMTSVRNSIHNMHDESVDLYTSLESIVKNFTFCPIIFEYDLKSVLNSKLKYSIIAIIKEGLSNVMKHSNATSVTLILREHPAMYQLILSDNGHIEKQKQIKLLKIMDNQLYYEGMGLQNIIDRVKSFDGNINITLDEGCKIFITFPKINVSNIIT